MEVLQLDKTDPPHSQIHTYHMVVGCGKQSLMSIQAREQAQSTINANTHDVNDSRVARKYVPKVPHLLLLCVLLSKRREHDVKRRMVAVCSGHS